MAQIPGFGDLVQSTPVTPFTVTGLIEAFKLDAGSPGPNPPYTQGATITVNHTPITIPANTVVIMPASQLTPYDIFASAPQADGKHSGLAYDDPDRFKPIASFEATIVGNVIKGRYVAGLVTISQEILNAHQGYITHIEYSTSPAANAGDFCVGPARTDSNRTQGSGCIAGETRLKLNDPIGRFGIQRTDQDPRFVVDDQNPTIRSVTGYPLCIPRNDPAQSDDPLCPRNNRPLDLLANATPLNGAQGTGLPLTRFVMDIQDLAPVVPGSAPVVGISTIPACPGCDPSQQTPLLVNDYITWNGTLGADQIGPFISAWQVVGQLGIYTKPCGVYGFADDPGPPRVPANLVCHHLRDDGYIEWEVGEIGTQGTLTDGVLIEGQDRIRLLGFSTDPTRQVEIYAVTSNPGNTLTATGSPPAIPADPSITTDANPPDGHLRWIANIVPERIPFGRWSLFVQRDIAKRLPSTTTAGVIPIIDNHVGLQGQSGQIEYGAPRQFYAHLSHSEAILGGQQHPHNVKPVPAGTPALQGWPLPTPGFVGASGVTQVMANGIVPSQYFQPIPTYVMPETIGIGDPLVANNFECLDFLVRGQRVSSPTSPGGTLVVGQLSPWPGGMPSGKSKTDGSAPPSSIRCSSVIPVGDPIPRAVPKGGLPLPMG